MPEINYSKDGKKFLRCPRDYQGEFIIPDSVTAIGDDAFRGCGGLTSVEIPDSVTFIGKSAFEDCSSLAEIDIPNSVAQMGAAAFRRCLSLKSIWIPDSISEIADEAFQGCRSLSYVDLPDTIAMIGKEAFKDCAELKKFVIPSGVSSIGERAFEGCSGLTNIEIPGSVKEIGGGAFSTGALLDIYVGIGNKSFHSWEGALLSIDKKRLLHCCPDEAGCFRVPDTVETIDAGCFRGLHLGKLQIPAAVRSIGDYAFSHASVLQLHIRCPYPKDLQISEMAFADRNDAEPSPCAFMKDCTLYVPVGARYAYRHHPVFCQFKEVLQER